MSAMDQEKFTAFLNFSCTDFYLHQFESISAENFEASVYCELPGEDYDDQCLRFIDKLSTSTDTRWLSGIRRQSKCVRYRFRKLFRCQKGKSNKSKAAHQNHVAIVSDCKAKIDFKWKFINRNTKKNDKNLKRNLSCLISIHFQHTHSVKSISTFVMTYHIKSSKSADELFKTYFKLGLSPSASRLYHEISLAWSCHLNMSAKDLSDILAAVSTRHILYLHDKWKCTNKLRTPLEELVAKKKQFENNQAGYYINLVESTLEVAIITPLMRAVLEAVIDEKKLSVFMVSTEHYQDIQSWPSKNLFCFFVPSKIGALPIGCVLQKSKNLSDPLTLLKDSIETVIGKPFTPGAIHIIDSPYEQAAIMEVFPTTKVFVSSNSLITSVWKWLNTPKKDTLCREYKRAILSQFKTLVKAETESEYMDVLSSLSQLTSLCQHTKKFFEGWWQRKHEWCYIYRKEYCKDNDCFIPCESSLRVFKDSILQRGRHFTDEAWIETICVVLEGYFKERLRDFTNSQQIKPHFSMFCRPIQGLVVKNVMSQHEFEFGFSDQDPKFPTFKVNFDLLPTCDCEQNGNLGKYCGHLCALEEQFMWTNLQPNLSELSSTEAAFFHQLAVACKLEKKLQVPNPILETKVCPVPFERVYVKYEADYEDDFNSDRETDNLDVEEVPKRCEYGKNSGQKTDDIDIEEFQFKCEPEEKKVTLMEIKTENSTSEIPFEFVATAVSESPTKDSVSISTSDPFGDNDQGNLIPTSTPVPSLKELSSILERKLGPSTSQQDDAYKKMTEQKFIVDQIRTEFNLILKILNGSLITCRQDLQPLYLFHESLQKIRSTTGAVEFMEASIRGQAIKRKESELGGQTVKSEHVDQDEDKSQEKKPKLE